MKTRVIKYVSSSDLFRGYEDFADIFANSDPDCSYGDNNFSLVDTAFLIDTILNTGEVDEDNKNWQMFVETVRRLPYNTYVNLES